MLTGEVNAAAEGLLASGGTDVVVWDRHDSGRTLSALDIHPKARLFVDRPISRTLELDSSNSAVVFIDQHAMAGAEKGILSHGYDSEGIQNLWANGKAPGELGARVMLAGPVEVKVEFRARAGATFGPREGVEQLNARTWVFRGKDILDAWLKYSSF